MEYWFSFLLMDYRFIYTVSTSNCIFILLYVRITDFILFWLMAVNVLLKGFSHFTFHQFMHYTPTEVFQKGRKRDRAGTKSFFLCLVPNILFPQESGSTLDHADKFPVGTKVQAVWSEDGEWWVEISVVIVLFSFLFFNFWSFIISSIILYLVFLFLVVDLVDFPGMMPPFMHILQMAIMFAMRTGVTRKRYCLLFML